MGKLILELNMERKRNKKMATKRKSASQKAYERVTNSFPHGLRVTICSPTIIHFNDYTCQWFARASTVEEYVEPKFEMNHEQYPDELYSDEEFEDAYIDEMHYAKHDAYSRWATSHEMIPYEKLPRSARKEANRLKLYENLGCMNMKSWNDANK
jgi:hypothetical protein